MQKLWNIFRRGLIYETGILVAFYLFSFILPMEQPGIDARYYFLILGFSMIFSLVQEIFSIGRLHIFARYALHYAAMLVCFILIYIFTGNYAQRGGTSLFVAIVLFSILYAIAAAISALIQSKVKQRKKQGTHSTYQKIYK